LQVDVANLTVMSTKPPAFPHLRLKEERDMSVKGCASAMWHHGLRPRRLVPPIAAAVMVALLCGFHAPMAMAASSPATPIWSYPGTTVTGTITITAGRVTLCRGKALSRGQATCSPAAGTTLPKGTYSIVATYSGNADYATSTSSAKPVRVDSTTGATQAVTPAPLMTSCSPFIDLSCGATGRVRQTGEGWQDGGSATLEQRRAPNSRTARHSRLGMLGPCRMMAR
jgi:hypothetical protein